MTDETETKRIKLPKRVAGMKLPKKFRRTAEMLIAEATTPAARELLAVGLIALAAAVRGGGAKAGGTDAPAATDKIGPMIGLAASALGQWLGDAGPKAERGPASMPETGEPTPKPH